MLALYRVFCLSACSIVLKLSLFLYPESVRGFLIGREGRCIPTKSEEGLCRGQNAT